jgi:hypothetical protein
MLMGASSGRNMSYDLGLVVAYLRVGFYESRS